MTIFPYPQLVGLQLIQITEDCKLYCSINLHLVLGFLWVFCEKLIYSLEKNQNWYDSNHLINMTFLAENKLLFIILLMSLEVLKQSYSHPLYLVGLKFGEKSELIMQVVTSQVFKNHSNNQMRGSLGTSAIISMSSNQ